MFRWTDAMINELSINGHIVDKNEVGEALVTG
jgi:hypothetical protein